MRSMPLQNTTVLHLVNNYAIVCAQNVIMVYDALTLNEMPTKIDLQRNKALCCASTQKLIATGMDNGVVMVLSALTMEQ